MSVNAGTNALLVTGARLIEYLATAKDKFLATPCAIPAFSLAVVPYCLYVLVYVFLIYPMNACDWLAVQVRATLCSRLPTSVKNSFSQLTCTIDSHRPVFALILLYREKGF